MGGCCCGCPPRCTPSWHSTAEREGVSLNQFITRALAGRIGWGTDADDQSAPDVTPADGRARLIAIALVVNAVVIGLAALAAIAVLVLAWRG